MTASEYQQLVEFLSRQFTAIDQRFDAIDERFREVFGHFDEIYRRLERLEQEYYAITQALRRIEGLLADEVIRRDLLERGVEELKRNVALLQTRIEELERRLRS
ncbi:MAG: hypothetical protein HY215_04480 [Candidatus Rokubacteria bacterium]|nr:hypothetical protein [Candidatus Rokubacteria bacterium]